MFASVIFVFFVASLAFVTTQHTGKLASLQSYQEPNSCVLPPYPEHGRYTVSNYPFARPGESYPSVKLDVSCDIGYKHESAIKNILCINAFWSATMPTCVRDLLGFCTLTDDISVEYRCASAPGSLKTQECESYVPSGSIVRPICRSPGYFSLKVLSEMHCRDGIWSYKPICKPACGVTTQHRQLEGTSTKYLELPWYAVIYMMSPRTESYEQRCAGTLITANKIISAAHCLCNYIDEPLPPSDFVVAVNKLYHLYDDSRDINSQESNVTDIIIPPTFLGEKSNYENDIAIVVLETPFFFHLSVRPVCLDFDDSLDRTQLTEGNSGKVAQWTSQVLKTIDFAYIKFEECFNHTPTDYQRYLTNDTFCAGSDNGTSLYKTDTGVGLAFPETSTQRYYLRGVLSGGRVFINDTIVNSFTSILKHKHFIKKHL